MIFRGKEIFFKSRPEFWNNLDQWEPETFNILERFLLPADKNKKHFLDLGAWNGVFSIYAFLLGAYPCAIEPDPVAFEEMSENLWLNKVRYGDCAALKVAISDGRGMIPLRNEKDGWGNSMSSILDRTKFPERSELTEYVKSMPLDYAIDWLGTRPTLIKMDIEGAEIKVISQAFKTLKETKCPLIISLHPEWYENGYHTEKQIKAELAEIYYRMEVVSKNQYLYLPE